MSSSFDSTFDQLIATKCDDTDPLQQWTLDQESGMICSLSSGRCLAPSNCEEKGEVVGRDKGEEEECDGWKMAGDKIINQQSNSCLEVYGSNDRIKFVGKRVQVWRCEPSFQEDSHLNQEWTFSNNILTNQWQGSCLSIDEDAPEGRGEEGWEVWMSEGVDEEEEERKVVVIFNRANQPQTITLDFQWVGLQSDTPYSLRDLWAQEDLGSFTSSFSVLLSPHESSMIQINLNN